jgi:hypothetical protein
MMVAGCHDLAKQNAEQVDATYELDGFGGRSAPLTPLTATVILTFNS